MGVLFLWAHRFLGVIRSLEFVRAACTEPRCSAIILEFVLESCRGNALSASITLRAPDHQPRTALTGTSVVTGSIASPTRN